MEEGSYHNSHTTLSIDMSFLYCRREAVFVEGFLDLDRIFGGLH